MATTWIGFHIASHLNDRPKQIRQLKSALQILEAEIVYSRATLVEAFNQVAKQTNRPIASFFESLCLELNNNIANLPMVWSEKVKGLINNSTLGVSEKEILEQFGQTLGQHDITQQIKYIQLAQTHLQRILENALDEQHRYSKMVKSLGFLAGLFIVLLLI
ncbi:stage III sporulation protein SpoIIIAB [Paraliobacillus ryukyuensis]|uniref:stage III sporulation protein SpoIIIAB n=1 Tax=Paraliobacillus ryukyuensis TaxID=200904 RepID=UPI001FE7B92A|nr:stage III sporulation protein SpoIIIAB [Paraliobacillus ryukyuensis]